MVHGEDSAGRQRCCITQQAFGLLQAGEMHGMAWRRAKSHLGDIVGKACKDL